MAFENSMWHTARPDRRVEDLAFKKGDLHALLFTVAVCCGSVIRVSTCCRSGGRGDEQVGRNVEDGVGHICGPTEHDAYQFHDAQALHPYPLCVGYVR